MLNPNNIRKALDLVNWERLFDRKIIETFSDTLHNFVPNKYITIDDNYHVWMNETIKSNIKAKHILWKTYIFIQYVINSNLQLVLTKT